MVVETVVAGAKAIKLLIVGAAFAITLTASAVVLLPSHDAYAEECGSSRKGCNDSEKSAWSSCGSGDVGAIWFNTGDTGANNTGGYYTDVVNVSADSDTVDVYIRGSACNQSTSNGYTVYATDIRPGSDASSQRLTVGDPKRLNRGYFNGNKWTTMGSSLAAKLNVAGLATNNIGREDNATITVQLGRCYSNSDANSGWNGVSNDKCYYNPVTVNIKRAASPNKWTINAQSYIKKSNSSTQNTDSGFSQPSGAINASPGEYIYWKHDLRVEDSFINQNFAWTMRWSGFPADFNNGGNQYIHWEGNVNEAQNSLFVRRGALPNYDPSYTIYQVRSSDAGRNLCQRIEWQPTAWNNPVANGTTYRCAYVPYNFSLVPSVTSPADGAIIESDQDIVDVAGQITNNGPTKSGTDVNWRITQINYAPSVSTIPNRSGGTGGDPCSYFTGEQSCNVLNQGNESDGFAYPSTKPYSASNGQLSNNPVGTKICFVLSVNKYNAANMGNANAWRHSALSCLIVGKKPKVQVWGGGVSAGKVFNGTSLQSSSKVATSLTTKSTKDPITQPAPAGAITGLWKTGVDESGNKLAEDKTDPHWEIDRVYRPAGTGGATCQRGYNSGGSFTSIPTTSGSHFQARTIREVDPNASAGQYVSVNTNSVTGDNVNTNPVNGSRVWLRASSSARWIGQNVYGQNYSSKDCTDPTGIGTGHSNEMSYSNIYVFKLKQPIRVDSSVNLDSINLTVKGAVDNTIKFFVNGCELVGTYSPDANNWQEPGWTPTSVAGAKASVRGSCANPNGFRHGDNSLEVHVQSTYSHTGILIDQISMDATVSTPVSNVFGSWSEYGIYAPSTINLMASSSGLNGGSTSSTQSSWSKLTFTNQISSPTTQSACNSIKYGCYYSEKKTLPDPSTTFPYETAVEQSGSSWNLSTLMKGRNIKPSTGVTTLNLTSNSTTLGSGQWLVINAPNSTVNITNDLRYTTSGSLSRADQIPQLIIIAGRINIASNVTQVDAWLIAKNGTTLDGRINTCSTTNTGADLPITQNLSSSLCDKTLRVNGPVVANMLYLRRTAGSGVKEQSGDPAEVFNLRPDAYIWARAKTEALGSLTTTYMVELPPRY